MSFRYRHRTHKYNAVRTICGNHSHPSKLEAKVCGELGLRVRCGDILHFQRQVPMELKIDKFRFGKLIVDFVVHHKIKDDCKVCYEVVEAKGVEMPDWKVKWALLKYIYRNHAEINKFTVVKS